MRVHYCVPHNTNHLKVYLHLRENLRRELVEGVPMGVEVQRQRGIMDISLILFITPIFNELFVEILFLYKNS